MKKTFKTFALMLLAALAFSSCVDVPVPYSLPEKSGSGDGTSELVGIPATCKEALDIINALSNGGATSKDYVVTGYITDVFEISGKPCFWMADTPDGGKIIEAFAATIPDGIDAFKVGMKVAAVGKLKKYVKNGNITPEVENPTVKILEGEGSGSGGNQDGNIEHITVAEFIAKADPNTTYELTGIVKNISNTTFGNFDLVEGDASIYIYGLLNLNGEKQKFASLGIEEGDEVTLTGKYKLYNNKAEIPDAQFVSVKKGGSGTTPSTDDEAVVADFAQGQGSWTVSDVSGSGIWTNDTRYGMVASGYINNTNQASESWLTSPEIDLTNSTNSKILLNEAINFGTSDVIAEQCQVYACINDGQTNWQLLTADKRPAGTSWTYQDDTFDASAFDGKKILLAFKYVSTESSAPKWEIKTVKIVGGGSSSQGGDSGQGGDGGNSGQGTVVATELVNGGFESWVSDTEAAGWKSASTASSAVVNKSTEARSGSYACLVKTGGTANKRLATQEISLAAGSYTFSFYAKATTTDNCQTRPGHVTIKADGSVNTYSYPKDSDNKYVYFNINNSEWTLVSYDFELSATTTICLLVMNPMGSSYSVAQDILIDDATLVKK